MGFYARDLIIGELPGPYDTDHAHRYARAALMPESDVLELVQADAAELVAHHFAVPLEQAELRLAELSDAAGR